MFTLALLLAVAQDVEVRAAIARAVPLIEKSAAVSRLERSCFTCHHQGVPVFALALARSKGFAVDEKNLEDQLKHTAESLANGRKAYLEGRGQGGKGATAAYALWTLEAGGWKGDETTASVADYLAGLDKERDHWPIPNNRPPSESSSFTTTALVLQALQAFGTSAKKDEIAARKEKARAWLLATKPKENEDRVFRLWGLKYAATDAVGAAAKELLDTQRADGGWEQIPERGSDAYATGSALVALHQAGGLPTTDAAYRRGIAFLVRTQKEDGSWLVETRSKPIQKHFESGFPHGKHQFISMAATSWSVAALALATGR